MTKLIIHVNPTESGLEEKKAKEIESLFLPMVKMVNDMEKAYNEVVSKDKTPETAAIARLLRLQIAAERVKADKARKSAKDEYLRAGNAIQGAYNAFLYASKSKEEKLLEIEKFAEVQERERIENLKNERSSILFELGVTEDEIQHIQLGEMKSDVWENYLFGQKASFKAKKEAEKQAELDRIAAENKAEEDRLAEIEKQKAIEAENEKLKREAELAEQERIEDEKQREAIAKFEAEKRIKRNKELQPYIIFIRDYEKMLSLSDEDYGKELLSIKRGAEEHWEFEKKEAEKKEKEALKLKKAQEELEAKKLEEEKKELAKLEAEQLKLKQGDSENIKDLIEDLIALKTKYVFKSKKFNHIYSQVGVLIDKVISHINKE